MRYLYINVLLRKYILSLLNLKNQNILNEKLILLVSSQKPISDLSFYISDLAYKFCLDKSHRYYDHKKMITTFLISIPSHFRSLILEVKRDNSCNWILCTFHMPENSLCCACGRSIALCYIQLRSYILLRYCLPSSIPTLLCLYRVLSIEPLGHKHGGNGTWLRPKLVGGYSDLIWLCFSPAFLLLLEKKKNGVYQY